MRTPFDFDLEAFEEPESGQTDEAIDLDEAVEGERGRRAPMARPAQRLGRRGGQFRFGRPPLRPGPSWPRPVWPRAGVAGRRRPRLIGRDYWPEQPEPGVAPPAESSAYVEWLQSSLNSILGLRLPVDGIMSPETRSAIRAFQRRYGLPADGIVGPDTERALMQARRSGQAAAGLPVGPYPEQEGFLGALWPFGSEAEIEDRTQFTRPHFLASLKTSRPKGKPEPRDPRTVYALVLHQMAFSRGNDHTRYDRVTAHYAILPDGQILQLHPVSTYLYASNGFNARSVAVEFAGNFPNTSGKCWEARKYGCHTLSAKQIDAGRKLIRRLVKEIGLTHVLAHRQSSGSRENDPGPDIWSQVGQWAVDTLGLRDGGPGFKIDSGKPIPEVWRTWARPGVARETSEPEIVFHGRPWPES
jgi:N-acetyl-anhydromuramyl-L-alanine amidase AmpD